MFTKKQKIKMVEIALVNGTEAAVRHYYRYYYKPPGFKRKYSKAAKAMRNSIKLWVNIYNSGNMNELKCKAGKAKGKGQGRPKKPKSIKELWDMFTDEERFIIFEDKIKEEREKSKKEKMKKQDQFENRLSQNKRSYLWVLSREGIRKFNLRGKTYKKRGGSEAIDDAIRKIALSHAEIVDTKVNFRKGRNYISNELKTLHSIDLKGRAVGYRMAKEGLSADVRRDKHSKKYWESKNTKVNLENHLDRNYSRDMTITADVKVIPHKSQTSNHVHLEPLIHIQSNYIIAWDLSYHQGIEQTMRNLKKVDLKQIDMFGSDHGSQYTSHEVQAYLKDNDVVQSCSRVANSLDNRPSEHWFGILQSECLNFHNIESYSFEKLKMAIENFIIYYNTKRKQEKLGWLTPEEFRNQNPSLCANF